MKFFNGVLGFTLLFLLGSCYNPRVDVFVPELSPEASLIADATPLTAATKSRLEGVYSVLSGSDLLGSSVVMKISGDRMSIFSGIQAGYVILQAGSLDSLVILEGFWRRQTGTETGLAQLHISKDEGGRFLLGDTAGFTGTITIRGLTGKGGRPPGNPLVLQYSHPINPQAIAKNFVILAHHGFQSADNMPASENSVEVIRILERYGANGVEVDVRLSKDRIPYLYHDEQLNPRLVQRTPLIGASENYTMAALKAFVRLLHGEQIPTLREAMEAVLNETTLNWVWLDLKTTDVQIISEVAPIQKDILNRARAMGRNLQIVVGLPTDSHVAEFLALPGHDSIPALCELTLDDVRSTGAIVWGPRWTRGLLLDEVDQMHSENRKVFSWTVSVPGYIESYLREGRFDGMISDYPSMVNYYLFTE